MPAHPGLFPDRRQTLKALPPALLLLPWAPACAQNPERNPSAAACTRCPPPFLQTVALPPLRVPAPPSLTWTACPPLRLPRWIEHWPFPLPPRSLPALRPHSETAGSEVEQGQQMPARASSYRSTSPER